MNTKTNLEADQERPAPGRRASAWPTLYAPLPMTESDRALEHGGTAGLAIYAALHKLRFLASPAHRSAFFCSEAQIARFCGITPRRLRDTLRSLEAAGLVRIARPEGIEKVRHQASKITLVPIFTDGNKIAARADETSAPDRTKRPLSTGQNHARKCPSSHSPPYYVGGDSCAAGAAGAVGAPAGGAESGSEQVKQRDPNEW